MASTLSWWEVQINCVRVTSSIFLTESWKVRVLPSIVYQVAASRLQLWRERRGLGWWCKNNTRPITWPCGVRPRKS